MRGISPRKQTRRDTPNSTMEILRSDTNMAMLQFLTICKGGCEEYVRELVRETLLYRRPSGRHFGFEHMPVPRAGRALQKPRSGTHTDSEIRSGSNFLPAPSGARTSGFEELAHAAEFFVALFEQHGGSEHKKIPKRAIENRIEKRGGSLVVQVRASFWFGNNFIDDAEMA